MPPMMQSASGSTVAVTLCFQAASPAGVSGSFNPGRSFAMLPPGLVSRVPFQYPLKSGCPSAMRGAGLFGPVGSGAVSSCAKTGEYANASTASTAEAFVNRDIVNPDMVTPLTSVQYYSIAK